MWLYVLLSCGVGSGATHGNSASTHRMAGAEESQRSLRESYVIAALALYATMATTTFILYQSASPLTSERLSSAPVLNAKGDYASTTDTASDAASTGWWPDRWIVAPAELCIAPLLVGTALCVHVLKHCLTKGFEGVVWQGVVLFRRDKEAFNEAGVAPLASSALVMLFIAIACYVLYLFSPTQQHTDMSLAFGFSVYLSYWRDCSAAE